jgi:eukaryotic-like serine/threonine-protein kinase
MLKIVTHRPLWINILVAVLVSLIIILLVVLSLDLCTHHNSSKTVPLVVGKTFDEAKKILDKGGFDIVVQDSVFVDSLKPTAVVKQIPESDAVVKVNRTVYLTINQAQPPMVAMPGLVNFTYRNAVMTLTSLGLVADTTYQTDFARDNVLKQLYNGNPITPGTKLPMGTHVTLVLGSGTMNQASYFVPDLIGLTYGDAKSRLEAKGINLNVLNAPGVTDSFSAFIDYQEPKQFSGGHAQMIRSGQLISVTLSAQRPVTDTTKNF